MTPAFFPCKMNAVHLAFSDFSSAPFQLICSHCECRSERRSPFLLFKAFAFILEYIKGDGVISPAARAKNTSNSGRNDAIIERCVLQSFRSFFQERRLASFPVLRARVHVFKCLSRTRYFCVETFESNKKQTFATVRKSLTRSGS